MLFKRSIGQSASVRLPTCHTDTGLCQAVALVAQRHCYLLDTLKVASGPASCNCPCQQLAADTVYVLTTACCHCVWRFALADGGAGATSQMARGGVVSCGLAQTVVRQVLLQQ